MISYKKILKQAWAITKTNRFLWWYGLLLFFGMGLNFSYSLSREETVPKPDAVKIPALEQFLSEPWALVLLLALGCLWLVVYFRAKAGMIIAVKLITEKQPASFLLTFKLARNFLTRLLGVSLFLQVLLGSLSLIIMTPVFYLFSTGATGRGLILAALGALIFIPTAFLVSFANVITPLFLVIFDMPIFQGMRAAVSVITATWRKLLWFTVLLAVIGVLASILAAIASSPFVILAILSYHRGGQIFGSLLCGVGALAVFLSFQAVISAFQQTAWTLFFMELVRPEKIEDEAVPIPDTAT